MVTNGTTEAHSRERNRRWTELSAVRYPTREQWIEAQQHVQWLYGQLKAQSLADVERPGERTPKDYAIEHGGYLADAVDHYITARNAHDRLEDDEDPKRLTMSADSLSDARMALVSAVFEFRKRAERARSAPEPAAKPVPCWCPYCDQPHSPRIQETSPVGGPHPCKCSDTVTDCAEDCGSPLGKGWHCRRSTTKDGGV